MTTFREKDWLRKPSSRTAHCTPRASMKRLKATLLQPCLHKDEVRKPKPRAAMTVISWKMAKREVKEEEEKEEETTGEGA